MTRDGRGPSTSNKRRALAATSTLQAPAPPAPRGIEEESRASPIDCILAQPLPLLKLNNPARSWKPCPMRDTHTKPTTASAYLPMPRDSSFATYGMASYASQTNVMRLSSWPQRPDIQFGVSQECLLAKRRSRRPGFSPLRPRITRPFPRTMMIRDPQHNRTERTQNSG